MSTNSEGQANLTIEHILAEGFDNIRTSEIQETFQKITNEITKDNILKYRELLEDPAYGMLFLADLGFAKTWECYREQGWLESEEDNTNIKKRMQVTVAEVLQWNKHAVIADITISVRNLRDHTYENCFAFVSDNNGEDIEKAKKYRCKLKNYLETYGTSIFHDGHLIQETPLDGLKLRNIKSSVAKESRNLFISNVVPSETEKERKPGETATYKGHVVSHVFDGEEKNYNTIHVARGNDTDYLAYSNEGTNIRTSVHLFLVLKNCKTISPNLIKAIEDLLQSLATIASLEELQERQRELERKEQMLMQLMEPLEQLTSGLARTIENAQRLRAVLWDPDKSIFSAASKVWLYFEQGAEPIVAGVPCKVEHNTDRYLDPKILGLTVLAIFSEIFGKDPKDAKNVSELWSWVRGDLTRNDDAMAQLRDTCQKILYTPKNGHDIKDVKDRIWVHLDSYVNSEEKWDNEDSKCNLDKHIEKVLERLKLLLHEPYKFAPGNVSVLPIALILFGKIDSEKTATLNIQQNRVPPHCKTFKNFKQVLEEEDLPKIFSGHNLPFPRVINLWTFVSRLVDQAAPNEVFPKCMSIKICDKVTKIELTFTKDNFEEDPNLVKRFLSLVGTKSSSSSLIGGDIMLPWLELALSCDGKACGEAKDGGVHITIKKCVDTFSIKTTGETLVIKAKRS